MIYINNSYFCQFGLNVVLGGVSVDMVQSVRVVYVIVKRVDEVEDDCLKVFYVYKVV